MSARPSSGVWIRVLLGVQRLELRRGERLLSDFPVSTSARGAGEREGSEQTPRGRHEVGTRVGTDAAAGTVFEGRQPTGEICTPERFRAEPERDWILTRILWLRGLEPGRNRGANGGIDVDTESRFIYIHGTPDEARIGEPRSHGCIRMRNADVIDLFDRVQVGTPVEIDESDGS